MLNLFSHNTGHTPYDRRIQQITALCLSAVTLFSFTACSAQSLFPTAAGDPVAVSGFKLNTFVRITAYGNNIDQTILENALRLCDQYENIFSRTKETSELYAVNHRQVTVLSSPLADLISKSLDYCRYSQGAFDISIGSISSLWDFTADNPAVPDSDAIAAALPAIDYEKVKLTSTALSNSSSNDSSALSISLPEGTMLDLGAVAKGYIADRIKEYLLANGINSALIDLGGNVLCVGTKPGNTNFGVGVRKPFDETGATLLNLSINDLSIVSSGTYERCFTDASGKFYHHILNPKTGYPYETNLTQVTIISRLSVDGDCFSTTCFTLGLEKGMELIENTPDVEAVFVTNDGTAHYSSGVQKYVMQ